MFILSPRSNICESRWCVRASGKQTRTFQTSAPAGDIADRKLTLDESNKLWIPDITEYPTHEGKIYCAVVLDTFSRRDVGWSIDSSQTTPLVTNILRMAISNRGPTPSALIHSDDGVRFTSWALTRQAHHSAWSHQ
ncbi:DDE-type integrase/transposase/recombinase [Rhodococcus sp. APC 3903]|uniref:DDE-type integrase/transposase/recombinase n=1 Tax=Rhodococcus sp. APC 3903 TaxID=3035193 RepID=UPI00339F132B